MNDGKSGISMVCFHERECGEMLFKWRVCWDEKLTAHRYPPSVKDVLAGGQVLHRSSSPLHCCRPGSADVHQGL